MIDRLTTACRRALQAVIITIVRPYVSRELPGWGRVYHAFVGSYTRDWLWANASPKVIRGKRHGYTMHLDPSNWADRSAYFLGRWYDLDTQSVLTDFVEAGDTVVDIGANRGMFSLAASHVVGKHGKVICFEPNPRCIEILEREIAENGIKNIHIRPIGLGEADAELTLTVPFINSGEGSFGTTTFTAQNSYQVSAQVKRGDEVLIDERPTLIKIDVEGYECQVLAGMGETLRRHHPVVLLEIIPQHLARCGATVAQLLGIMEALGYRGFVSRTWREGLSDRWSLVPLDVRDIGTSVADVVWVHAESKRSRSNALGAHTWQ